METLEIPKIAPYGLNSQGIDLLPISSGAQASASVQELQLYALSGDCYETLLPPVQSDDLFSALNLFELVSLAL